jgi:hypothetical protein
MYKYLVLPHLPFLPPSPLQTFFLFHKKGNIKKRCTALRKRRSSCDVMHCTGFIPEALRPTSERKYLPISTGAVCIYIIKQTKGK